MRFKRRVFCIALTLFNVLVDTSVLPFSGLDMRFVPRISLVSVLLIGTVLGATQGIIYGAFAGIMLGICAFQPPGLIAISYTVCAMLAGIISNRSKPSLVTLIPPLVGYTLYEITVLIYSYIETGFFPLAKFGNAGIRLLIALVLIQLLYIPVVRILKPTYIGRSRR